MAVKIIMAILLTWVTLAALLAAGELLDMEVPKWIVMLPAAILYTLAVLLGRFFYWFAEPLKEPAASRYLVSIGINPWNTKGGELRERLTDEQKWEFCKKLKNQKLRDAAVKRLMD